MDAGIRIPKGILTGNFHDMGNYYQCLGINERIPSSVIEGKYCKINVPLDFWYSLPKLLGPAEFPWRDLDTNKFPYNEFIYPIRMFQNFKQGLNISGLMSNSLSRGLFFKLAICIPKVCTTGEAISGLLLNTTPIDFVYEDNFCRLPNDKPWMPADYVAILIFSLIGLLTILSTSYDIYYSVIRKTVQLLKNLHLFYLNRLLRLLPILATFVLAQASVLNHVADGPDWNMVASSTHNCRLYWWSTLLYIQNFLKFQNTCLYHTWYLAVDMQLYFISPIVLYWVLNGRKLYSWSALLVALSLAMISASIYNVKMRFPSSPVVPSRLHEVSYYMVHYYINPLTRSPPFIIGMVYGYMLHLNRGKNVILSKLQVSILWACAVVIMGTVIYSAYPVMQADWDNQTVDTLINCLMKVSWALAIGWLVFACTHGYGGPINWFLSLRMWKVPSRLSYAMYIIHYPLLLVVNSTAVAPVYFTMSFSMIHFINIAALTIIVSFIVVVLIDAPCSVLIKHFVGTGIKRPQNQLVRSQPIRGSVNNAFISDTSMVDLNKVS